MTYNNSEKVKRWRSNTKIRIVEAMGGKCVICDYNKCNRGLDLHHLNPEEKEFGFGRIMSRPCSWKKIIKELRKCVLICCRCHAEVHDGITIIPVNVNRFDEKYVEYKENKKDMDKCPICHKPKKKYNKTCSYSCAAKLSRKVDWDSINLNEMLSKGMSYNSIGRLLDVSGSAVKKRATKMKLIPL
jgi:hypothetical protein